MRFPRSSQASESGRRRQATVVSNIWVLCTHTPASRVSLPCEWKEARGRSDLARHERFLAGCGWSTASLASASRASPLRRPLHSFLAAMGYFDRFKCSSQSPVSCPTWTPRPEPSARTLCACTASSVGQDQARRRLQRPAQGVLCPIGGRGACMMKIRSGQSRGRQSTQHRLAG